jgi:hypothetical protein
VRSDSKSLDLYNDVCKSIVPYVPSAHGISLPLHRQGLRRITGNFNLISEKLNSLQMPWFCTSGTLLGFVREGQLISYDDDMDFVAYLGEFDCNANLRNEIDKFYEKNKNIISKGMNDLHYRLLNVGVSADLFLSWGDLNGNIYIYPWCSAQLGSSEIFPLDVINIEGHKFNIPRNPEACLKLNYGDQWRVPNPLWRFDWDKSNLLFKEFLF